MNFRTVNKNRKRIFVGCEGESEQSYVAVLQRRLGANAAFHLVAKVLNGGDPLALIESAMKALRAERTKGRDTFEKRFLLLDSDLLGRSPQRDANAKKLAVAAQVELIWQVPCHEALLLRHLPKSSNKRPVSSSDSLAALQREWPQYKKNTPAQELEHRINIEALRRAVVNHLEVEPLLRCIGIVCN